MSEKTNRALIATTAVAAAVGCVATFKIYRKWQKICDEKERCLMDHAEGIDPKDLEILAHSGNYALRKSAEQVLTDRIVSGQHLNYLLEQCMSENKRERKKAACVLSIIAKTREFKKLLVKNNAFGVVFKCIRIISEDFQVAKLAEKCYVDYEIEQTLKFAIVTIFDLISESEKYLKKFFKSCKELIGFLLELICDPSDSITTDIRRLSILILQQMMENEEMRCNLISYGMIQRTSLCFLRTIGDAWLSRNCLQILVMHINLFEDYVTEEFLQEMAQLGTIPVLIGCLKSDDPDLIYWSTALIHEFLLKDLHRGVIAKIPNLVKTLYQILVSTESSLQRLILRIYCFLSINDDNFKNKLLNFKPLLKRLSVCLASGNNDLVYWSLVLVHDLAMMGKQSAVQMINANEDLLKSVMSYAESTADGPWDIKHVAETLGFFCSCESLHKRAIENGCIKIILNLLRSESTELQFWASALLLNLSMSSDDARSRIIKDGGVGLLLEMAVKESEVPQITSQASKILVMLGFTDAELQLDLKSGLDSSIKIDGKQYSAMKDGINVVTINLLDFKISKVERFQANIFTQVYYQHLTEKWKHGRVFDMSSPSDAVHLLAELRTRRQSELVILTTQGNMSSSVEEPQSANVFHLLQDYGLDISNAEECNSWCIVTQVTREAHIRPMVSKQSRTVCDWSLSFKLADQVNSFVQEDLLKPLLNILMSGPASSNISKVPELEVLSTLARHERHRSVMLSTNGLLEYLAELIWCFSCVEDISSKPLLIAHCVGALKICHSLSTNLSDCDKLFDGPVLSAIKSFLLTSCSILLVSLKEDETYLERSNARLSLFTPDEDIFVDSGMPHSRNRDQKFPKHPISPAEKAARRSRIESQNADQENGRWAQNDVKVSSYQKPEFPAIPLRSDSDLISPMCADPTTQGDQLQALIAQVTFEKTFSGFDDGVSPIEGGAFETQRSKDDEKARGYDFDGFAYVAGSGATEEPLEANQNVPNEFASRRGPNRESRLSERSRGSRRSERLEEAENDHYDYDDFEEEDLPPILDNDDDDLGVFQGRGFFDLPRMASGQRMRSSSTFNPNEWPTTGSGRLSRTLNEAAQRAKSPLKDIASDLEDFDEALVNLTNYALMTIYFMVHHKNPCEIQNSTDTSRLVHLLWCIVLGCKQENRIQWGMIVSAIITRLCTATSESRVPQEDANKLVRLDVTGMTPSMIVSSDHYEVYNGNWTFESATSTRSVCKSGQTKTDILGWYYEVTIFSKGIIQIGWTSDRALHEPEKGLGVGDSTRSIGFDGSRCKLWNGQEASEDSTDKIYGKKWSIGDTVSCLLSVDGDVSFWLNGQDLGVGLRGIDTNLDWYPAVSLSLEQQCRVNFGHDPFLYDPPLGFLSVADYANIATVVTCSPLDSVKKGHDSDSVEEFLLDAKRPAIRRAEDGRSSTVKTPTFADRRPLSSRVNCNYKQKSNLDFSPKDLIDANESGFEVSEIMYYEVKRGNQNDMADFEIGYQSATRDCRKTCRVMGNKVRLSNDEGSVIQFTDAVGCGLIWPSKKMFFTTDGIGANVSIDLADSNCPWSEDLDEIMPYFSKPGLHVNFGQQALWAQAMNLSTYRRGSFQRMYDAVLRSEEGIQGFT